MAQYRNLDDSHPGRTDCPPARRAGWIRHWRWRCLGLLIGLGSLAWFLIRVIRKPSRAAYPCQRVAFALASSFVLWLLALAGLAVAFRHARRHFTQARLLAGTLRLAVSIGILWLLMAPAGEPAIGANMPTPSQPVGVARGV